jgi:hypothetical protein
MGKKHNGALRAHNQFKDAILINTESYYDYLDRFKKIATSIFEWKNLPESMDGRYLELTLYYLGKAAFLKDEKFGYLNTKCASGGNLNIYGLPTSLNCWSYSYNTFRQTYQGFSDKEKLDDIAILVMNNNQMTATASSIELFAYRLAEAQRTADLNIKQQKFPRLILTDKKQELTMRNTVNQIDDNELNIYVDKNLMTPEAIRSIDNEVPYLADKIMDYKREIWNEALTFLGISNMDTKKERQIVAESDSKNELINLNLQSYLYPRKKACEEFNKVFGTNIDVVVRSDLHNLIKEVDNSFADIKENIADEVVEDAIKEKNNE